jgi:uncharacterized protein (TIGR03435 family)
MAKLHGGDSFRRGYHRWRVYGLPMIILKHEAVPMGSLGAVAILTTLTSALLCAQTRNTPAPSPDGSDTDVHLINTSLRDLIARAYQLEPLQVIGPMWLQEHRMDLIGQPPPGTTPDQIPHLLQMFLTQRFKLAVHQSTRAMQVALLEVAPEGPQLDETPAYNRTGKPGACAYRRASRYRPAGQVCQAISMPDLAERLYGEEWPKALPLLDRTGLKGVYDFILPNAGQFFALGSRGYQTWLAVPSIRDQIKSLGLTIEQRKERVKVIVVDHCEKKPVEE